MATVEGLKEIFESNRKIGKRPILEFHHGIWICADTFEARDNFVLFYLEGHLSGLVRKDVFEKVKWGKPNIKPRPKKPKNKEDD
jgi:hypothetical protein